MASAASSFRSSASRRSTSSSPPCIWPEIKPSLRGANPSASCHSGAMQSIEPGISRFRVWCYAPSRNDVANKMDCFASLVMTKKLETHHVERNSPRHHRSGHFDPDHGPCLSVGHDRDRRRDLSEAGG